ncbi:helix-turn-helix domain-containing protein [Arabiibacter massiliensis]|uniref:helix-turn-helix domain-containing protein n=1 Tax=Arabiibacter massiliensis TaxID=1870985 RepID=UPI0009BA986D|nr:helix-turn-helix transcriptional regulator [Arabiibacter massiliensis]
MERNSLFSMDAYAYKKIIGGKVRAARRAHGISVEKLALMVGINRNYLRNIEFGRANPTIDIIIRIADGLSIPVWELMKPNEDVQDC